MKCLICGSNNRLNRSFQQPLSRPTIRYILAVSRLLRRASPSRSLQSGIDGGINLNCIAHSSEVAWVLLAIYDEHDFLKKQLFSSRLEQDYTAWQKRDWRHDIRAMIRTDRHRLHLTTGLCCLRLWRTGWVQNASGDDRVLAAPLACPERKAFSCPAKTAFACRKACWTKG